MRQLPPWFEQPGKRQVKSPSVYRRDRRLLHALLESPPLAAMLVRRQVHSRNRKTGTSAPERLEFRENLACLNKARPIS